MVVRAAVGPIGGFSVAVFLSRVPQGGRPGWQDPIAQSAGVFRIPAVRADLGRVMLPQVVVKAGETSVGDRPPDDTPGKARLGRLQRDLALASFPPQRPFGPFLVAGVSSTPSQVAIESP